MSRTMPRNRITNNIILFFLLMHGKLFILIFYVDKTLIINRQLAQFRNIIIAL